MKHRIMALLAGLGVLTASVLVAPGASAGATVSQAPQAAVAAAAAASPGTVVGSCQPVYSTSHGLWWVGTMWQDYGHSSTAGNGASMKMYLPDCGKCEVGGRYYNYNVGVSGFSNQITTLQYFSFMPRTYGCNNITFYSDNTAYTWRCDKTCTLNNVWLDFSANPLNDHMNFMSIWATA